LALLIQNKAILCKNLITTLVFEKNANFLPKIAEICDHNIDPWPPCSRLSKIVALSKNEEDEVCSILSLG
jgi:hypothetical protein